MVGGSGQYPARETIPIATRTDTHTIPRISRLTHLAAVRVQGEIDSLTGIEDEDLVLYPTRQYIAGLLKRGRREADGGLVVVSASSSLGA